MEEYTSITCADLLTQESNKVNISSKEMENELPVYIPKDITTTNDNSASAYAIIGPTDDRRLVTDTTQYPYSAIAYIYVEWPNNTRTMASGFMINYNKAMTSAHVVYDNERGGLAKKVQVIPGKNGPFIWNSPYHSAYTKNIYYPTEYPSLDPTTENAVKNDWAVLKLDSSIGNDCGWLNLQSGGITIGETGDDFSISGYPVHESPNNNFDDFKTDDLLNHRKEYQYCARGKILSANLKYFTHNIDALKGQSGSPIYFISSRDNLAHVVGIYYGCQVDNSINYGVRITSTIINTANSF